MNVTYHTLELGPRAGAYILTRKAVKNINLRIKQDGSLHVSANPHVPLERIEDFLRRQTTFILNALEAIEKRPSFSLCSGETLYINGKGYRLSIVQGKTRGYEKTSDHTITFTVKNPEQIEERVFVYHCLLRDEAAILFSRSLHRVYKIVQEKELPMPRVTIRFMKTRWGSLTPKRNHMSLNAYLAIMPDGCIDQVVAHEFCHFLELNHSKRFYQWLTYFMADWKYWKREMDRYSPYLI